MDYGIYDPVSKNELDHVREILTCAVPDKAPLFTHVLMNSWYAAKDLFLFIESLGKFYCCPLKASRQVVCGIYVITEQWSYSQICMRNFFIIFRLIDFTKIC